MSDLQTREMLAYAGEEVALEFHLTSRLYPPPDRAFYPAIKLAIKAGKLGAWETEIALPNGLVKTAGEIVEQLHLECFCEEPGEEWEEDDG